jgi:hypothetical protein
LLSGCFTNHFGIELAGGVKTLSRLLDLQARHLLPSGASVRDLGAQEIYAKGNEDYIRSFIQYFSDRGSRLRPAGAYSDEEIARLADRTYPGELLRGPSPVANDLLLSAKALDRFSGWEAPRELLIAVSRSAPPAGSAAD